MDFSVNPVGIAFEAFGRPHLVALGLVVLANLGLVAVALTVGTAPRRSVQLGLAAAILTAFTAHTAWRVYAGLWDVRDDLPLQLCDVMAIVTAWALVSQQRFLYDFVYFLGIAGAAQALFASPVGIYGYPHLYFVCSMLSHGAMVTAGVQCAVLEGYRPTLRSLWRVAAWAIAYTVVIFGLNLWLGSNYLFIGHKPAFPSLIDSLGPWPLYVPVIVGIGLVLFHLLYLPFALHDWRRHADRQSRSPLQDSPRSPF